MIDPSLFWPFLAGALVLNLTPGQDVAFTAATATRGGARAGIAAAVGIGAGCIVWTLLSAGGVAALLRADENAFMFLRLAGGAFLLYLAAQAIGQLDQPVEPRIEADTARPFRSGVLNNLLNPKVGLFFLSFLPAFINPAFGPAWAQTLLLGAVFTATGVIVLFIVAFAAGAVRARLARTDRVRMALNALAAMMFGLLGLSLLFTTEH